METAYDGRQIVGMDLHRRRSVLVRMTEDGRRLGTARIANSPRELRAQIARAGKSPRVVLEATYGWYWAADTLAAAGAEVHLAHPLGVKAFTYRRVKDDIRDAADLADLLRMGRLPEAWIAPAPVRELRELTRYRQKLVGLRTSCRDQVHAVLAKLGVPVTCSDVFGVSGSAWLDGLRLPQPYAGKVTSLRHLAGELTTEITMLSEVTADLLAGDRGYQVIQQLPGIGPVLAAVIIAEIGDVTRFPSAPQLCSWAGLTPRHRESDIKVVRGRITKMVCAGGMVPLRRPEVCDGGGWRIGFAPGSADVRLCRYRDGRELAWPDLSGGPGEPARVAAPVRRRAGR
jgi:transposase